MTSCPLLSFFALYAVSYVRQIKQTMCIPNACKVQKVTVGQLSHQTNVDRLSLEVFWRLVVDETQIGTDPYGNMLTGADDLLGQ